MQQSYGKLCRHRPISSRRFLNIGRSKARLHVPSRNTATSGSAELMSTSESNVRWLRECEIQTRCRGRGRFQPEDHVGIFAGLRMVLHTVAIARSERGDAL